MTPMRLDPAAPRPRVKHSTTEPLRSLPPSFVYYWILFSGLTQYTWDSPLCIIGVSGYNFEINIVQFCLKIFFFYMNSIKVSKGAKIRNRYNQVPHLTQDTNGKVTNSQLDTTNESQEVSPFPAGDHKAHINIRAQRHSKHKTQQKHKR